MHKDLFNSVDQGLLDSLAFMKSVESLIDERLSRCTPENLFSMLKIDYTSVQSIRNQNSLIPEYHNYFTRLANKLEALYHEWEKTIFVKIMGHYKRYAVLYVKTQDAKPTIDMIEANSAFLFSENRNELEKRTLATSCFIEYKKQFNKKCSIDAESEEFKSGLDNFYNVMYGSYDVTYEGLIRKQNELKLTKKTTEDLAESFNKTSYCINNTIKILEEFNNRFEITPEVAHKLQRLVEYTTRNPNVSSTELASVLNNV